MFIFGFLLGFISCVLLLLFIVIFFVFILFENKRPNKEHGQQSMSPQKTRIPNELKAFLRSCTGGDGSEWESCSSLSLLLHFLFQEHKDTRQFRRWFYKKLQLELNDVTARSSTAGRIIQGIQIRDLEAGMNSPMVNNVRVESFKLAEDDPDLFEELVLLLDVDYRGGFQMSVDANMAFGKFAQLSVKLLQLNGRARFSIRRQPFAHWGFSFVEAPQMELKIDSQFQGRSLRHLIPLINSAFRKAIQLKHVWPNYKLRFRPFFQNPLYSPSPNAAAFEHINLTGTGLEVTVLSASRLNLLGLDSFSGSLFCRVTIDKRPFNPYQCNDENTREKMRRAAHLLSVLLQFTRKGTGDSLGLTFDANNKEPNGREVRVATVEPGSNAEKSGFRVNDTLVAVNNIPVRNERQAARLLTGTACDLVVLVEREFNESENSGEESEDGEEKEAELLTNDTDFVSLPNFPTYNAQPIEYLAKDAFEGEIPNEAIFEKCRQTKGQRNCFAKREALNRKKSRSSERTTKISRGKILRRSWSDSEIRISWVEGANSLPQKESNELVYPGKENEKITGWREPSKDAEGIASENAGEEKCQKQNISRREKIHAKANEMALKLGKSKINEFIWGKRKPVEMAVEVDSNESVEANKTERRRLEKSRKKWDRKTSPMSLISSKIEKKMTADEECAAATTNSRSTKSVQTNRNPIWGQSLHFGLDKDLLYLNVRIYAAKNSDVSQQNDEEETMLGWTSVFVPRILEDCSLTLSNCHRERFHLKEPNGDSHSIPAEFDELSRHNGFDRRLCFGDLLMAFRFFPDGLPAELNEDASVSSRDQFADGTSSPKLTDGPCQNLSPFSPQSEHRWVLLKHKQSFNTNCVICGGKFWLKWANHCEKCNLVCHAKCLEKAPKNRECHAIAGTFAFDDDTFVEFDTDEISERKGSDDVPNSHKQPTTGNEPTASPLEKCPSDVKNASSSCRRRRIAEKLQSFSALTLKSVQEYSRRRATQKGQPEEKDVGTSELASPDSPKTELAESLPMVSIAEVLEADLLNSLEGFEPNSQFSALKFEPGNAYNPQVVCEAKAKGQLLLDSCETEERKKRINEQIDRVQAEIETVTRLRRSLSTKSGIDFERVEKRLQALAFIMMLYCYALNDCHEREETAIGDVNHESR